MAKYKKTAALLLAMILTFSACGDKKTVVTDYGQASESDSDDESGDFKQEGSGKKLSEMLGGTQLSYKKDFDLDGRNVTIDVSYDVSETEKLSIVKVEKLDNSQFNEADLVSKILGDSAKPLDGADRNMLRESDGDSAMIITTIQYVMARNGESISTRDGASPAWNDGGDYYYHTYEGTHDGVNYQLVVSYSKKENEFVFGYYPTDFSQIAESSDVDSFGYVYPDGNFYFYQGTTMKSYQADELGDGSPNKCDKSDKELKEMIQSDLSDTLGIDVPTECIAFDDSIFLMPMQTNGDEQYKSELVYFDNDKVSSGDLSGIIRDGYQATAMYSICNQPIMANPDSLDFDAYELQGSIIFVNNSGVMGMSFTSRYNFKETAVENVDVISFEQAMDSFIPAIQNNLKGAELDTYTGIIKFNYVDLFYYPIESEENSGEYLMTPVWALTITRSSGQPMACVLINATDGSYIKTLYPSK